MNRLINDYYNNHYKHVNRGFNAINYGKLILKENSDILTSTNLRILEIGCGSGFLLNALELSGFNNITGVEVDFNQSEIAKKNTLKSKIINQDIFDFFSTNSEKFDIVFLYDLIEHIEKKNIIALLKLVCKSLPDSGVLVIKTTNADSVMFASRMRYIDFTHEISFNKESIEMVLREAGFMDIKVRKPKTISSLIKFVILPFKLICNVLLRLYLSMYIGVCAFKIILEPNFIIRAKK